METMYTDIGYRIKELRHIHNMTQDQLAERMDISIKHMSAVERGVSSLSLEKLVQICKVLDCSLDYLILGKSLITAETYLPNTIIEILSSSDEEEKRMFLKYIEMYTQIHRR
ncbi:MAG: helix-turn-helix transcriptional regulator [Lachnospiraceae bacterium]|nr:helix-turn-helix transcriptional regulator [Lachnospiraceae bacterium]MBR6158329.1 helix-turn-helix transcriptional regulator [Lachnospiraceae bacterium]